MSDKYGLDAVLHANQPGRRRMPPGPNDRASINYGGFDSSGPLDLSHLEKPESNFVPYETRVSEYKDKHGDLPPNPFATGLQAGFLGGFAGDVGFAETLSDVIPSDPGKESLKSAGDFLEKEAYKYPMRTLRDIHDVGDLGGFISQSIGQTFGYIGSMIPTTIATGGVGAIGRIVGKEALKGLTKKEIAKQGAKAVGRAVTAPSIVKNIGHTYRGVREETGVESPGIAVPVGIASGMMERFGLGKTFESYFDALPVGQKKELWGRMVGSAIKAAGKSALIEGGTEAGQESLQLLANRLADSTYDMVNGENAWRILDATAMGAFGAAPIGAVGGAGNYYTAVSKEEDRKRLEKVKSKLDKENRIQVKGSPLLFAQGQREIQKHADLLDDSELIPTEEQVSSLERFSERIPSYASLSDEQKKALQSNANSVLARFKERVGTAHADKKADEAQAQSDLETAAKENREAAEQSVSPVQQVMPEPAILPEDRAPYRYPENEYQVGQEYKHMLHSPAGGGPIQVDAVVTKVGRDGRVLEAVASDTVNDNQPTPLIVTRRKKTRSLHTQEEVEAEMNLSARDLTDPRFAETSEERSSSFAEISDRIRRQRAQDKINEQVAADAGATITGPKGRTAEQNIQKQQEVAARKSPLKDAKTGRFRKVYTAEAAPQTTAQSEQARLSRAKKAIENSSIVEVSKPGEKRSVGEVKEVKLMPFAGESHGQRTFVAEVIFEDGEDIVSILEDFSISQPMNGGVIVLARNGKLTKEQEALVASVEAVTEQQEADSVASKRANYSQIFGERQPRATDESSPHVQQPAKEVNLTKKDVQNPPPKGRGIISGQELDPDLAQADNALQEEQHADDNLTFDITGTVPYAIKRISIIIQRIVIDIKQAIRNARKAGDNRKLTRKTRRTKKKGSISYADLRKEIINKYIKELSEVKRDSVSSHLPAYGDDPERFLGGLVDAVVEEGSAAYEEGVSQDRQMEILSKVQDSLSKYIDFPISDRSDDSRTIVAANSNVHKNTDTGWIINGLDLYTDDTNTVFTAVLDFSTQHGNVVSIKAMGKNMDALSYRLKPEAMEMVRFQESEIDGREGIITFAHIPESLLIDEDGNVQYDNWEYDKSKGGGRFLKDISWVGVSRDDFIDLVKERTKSKQLKMLLESEVGETAFSSKDQIAGIISNAVSLAKDPRYNSLKKKKTAAFKAISKISKGKVANLKIEQLPKLFEHAVNLHLDHFATITEDQLSEVDPAINEINRLTAYRNKLKFAIEGKVPKTIDLPKIGTVVDTGELTVSGKKKGKLRYRIENVPNNPSNLNPILAADMRVPMKDKYFSFAEKREATEEREALPEVPKNWKRQTLRPEDVKFAKEMLGELNAKIAELNRIVDAAAGQRTENLVNLRATVLPATARRAAYEAREETIGDVDLLMEPQDEAEASTIEREVFDEAVRGRTYSLRVSEANNVVQGILEYQRGDASLVDVFSNVFFYDSGIAAEQQKFGYEYRSTLLVDEAKETNLAEEAGDKVNRMGVEVGGETAATGEVSPIDVIEEKESEVELEKFEEGGFEENTELGKASKRFRAARKKLVELVQGGSASDEDYTTKLIGYQVQMLDAWNEFLEKRGTDFLLFDGVTPQVKSSRDYDLYNTLRRENISRMEASSVYESREDKIERYIRKFEEADNLEQGLFDAFKSADKASQEILTQIKKQTQKFLDTARQTEGGWQVLMDLGWAGPRGGVKKLTESDVTLEAVLLNPEKFADPFQKIKERRKKEDISMDLWFSDPKDKGEGGFIGEDFPLRGLGQAGNFEGLSSATTAKLTDLKPSIDEYKEARANRDALASALTMFDQELGYMYGLGRSIYASDALPRDVSIKDEFGLIKRGKGVFGRGEQRVNAKDFERLRKREAQLADDIAEFKEAGLDVDAARARRERKQVNKILTHFREIAVSKQAKKEFKLTAKKVKKRGAYFKIIFDSFYRGGARSMDPGLMFGTLVSLSNKFNEDQYRATGKFVQVSIKKTEKVETPATLYYKLYKILELRDPYKILEHPLFSNSGLYLGPIIPEGKTKEWLIDIKEKRRAAIDGKIRSYASDYNLDENQARRMFLRNDMLGAVWNEFIQLFTHEAGMIDKESIVKKVTDLGPKREMVLDYLAQGLDVPFKPKIVDEADLNQEQVQQETAKLADALGKAQDKLEKAKRDFADNKDLIDRSKRGAVGIARERGAKSFKGVLGEVDKLKEKEDTLRKNLQDAEADVMVATNALNSIEADLKAITGDQTKVLESAKLAHKKNQRDLSDAKKRTDLSADKKKKLIDALNEKVSESKENLRLSVEGQRMSGNSLDIIPSKYMSTTLQQTMPFGYTAVKSDKPSPDLPIEGGRPWDAMLASDGAKVTEESKEIGTSIGADGIAQLLEDNRARLGDVFVDKAAAFLGNIPSKYLNELTLSIRTSLRSDKGVELGGSFMEAIKTVFIPTDGSTPDSFVHEMSHYLHAFLPLEMQSKITDMRRDALRGVISGTKDGEYRYRLEIAEDILSNVDSRNHFDIDHFQEYVDKYGDRAKDMYHLINDNEFFAYIMTKEGQSDMTRLIPQNNPVGFVSRAKQFLSDLVDWILKKARFVSAEKQFVDEVVSKFKNGSFSLERRKFTAGPAVDASILTAKDLNREIEFNVRTSLLGEEGNVEAGRKLSLEASSFHNMLYELSQKILKDMGKEDKYRNLLGKTKFKEGEFVVEPDDEITISRRAAGLAGIRESEAIRKILEENEVSTGGVVYSAEGYLELFKIRQKNPDAIPQSMWEQVSREFFKNTEEFLESYRRIKASAEKVETEKEVEKLASLMSEVKEKFGTRDVAKKSAASFKSMYKSMLEKVKDRSAENEAIRRLEQYGFDLNQLTSQLDDKLVGSEIFRSVEDFYNAIWFNEDAQIILHKGINREGEKATWKDLVWTYIVEKGIHEKYLRKKDIRPYRTRGKGVVKRDIDALWERDMEAMFAEVEPIMKFAADHILKKHQNDLLLNEVSEQQLRGSFEAYTDYEKELSDLFEIDEKKAADKLIKDYTSATGDLAVANRLFLSIRRSVLSKIKKKNDILVGAELAGRIVESKEFSEARKQAAYEIQAKPEEEIRFDKERAHFPHPIPEKSLTIEYDLSDVKGRERQLERLSLYIQDINDWLGKNTEDPFVPAWKEIRDFASATMLSPTMRSGQSMKAIANFSYLRPIQNLLANIGTYTSRMAMQHLDNWSLTLERSANWRDSHSDKMAKALMNAAVSHGFERGPVGVADWVSVVGRRFFGTANQVGRKLSVGDVVTRSNLTEVKTITKEDEAALKLQVEAFGELFDMDVKEGRGDVILSRKIKDPLRRRGRGREKVIGRKALKVTPWTLPKRFNDVAKRFAQIVSSILSDSDKESKDIDEMEGLSDKDRRELKLKLFTRENRKGDSIMRLISEDFDRVILPFLDNREGNITRGTNPFFTEGVYDEAKDAMLAGEINDLADLASFFSERSVDITKLGEEDAPMQLNNKEALYELLREISLQAKGFNDFLSPPVDSERQDYKYQKLQQDSPFTTARQEAVANYFYYDYGSFDTVGMANMSIEAGTQYLDMYMSSMEAIVGELTAAVNDKKRAAESGFLDDFRDEKKQGAANKEVFLDYERAESHLANVQHEITQLRQHQERDVKYELQTNRTFRRVYGDMIGAATQLLTVGVANIVGTPVRGAMRMQSMFGAAPRLNANFAGVALKEMAKGAASFGVGFTKGAFYALGYLGTFKPRKALIKFVDEFVNQPFVKDISIGQYKLNTTLRRLHDAGYAMKIDVQGKIDAYLDTVETRGRIEREEELRTRSDSRSVLSKLYNGAALFLVEIPGMTTPRLFDAIGNNVSFAWANTAVSNLEIRLKDLHRRYGASLWDRYNDPDSLVKDPNKANTLSPVDVFGEQFIFKGDESKLGQLENMFTHAALDYHAEALRFYKLLETDKEATFLSPEQRAQVGIGIVTSENLATVANRPLAMRNDPNVGFALALAGWSISAAHNSVEFLSRARGGKQGWAMDSLNVQIALVALGMMTVGAIGWVTQEQILRMIYKHLFGEIKVGKHPWEADSVGEGGRRALLYALSGFPILNSVPNQMLNDQKNMAGMGPDLFIQNKLRDIINVAGQMATTRNYEGWERAITVYLKQTYPNSRYLVNRFPTISGTVDLRNNSRLIRRYAPRDMVKVTSYTGGGLTATPLTPMVALMANYATLGEWDLFNEYYRKAIREARILGRPNPETYVRSLYFGKDPYRAALKGRPTQSVRRRVINAMSDEDREEYLRVENNFYNGLTRIGGSRPSFGGRVPFAPLSKPKGGKASGTRWRPTIPLPDMASPRPLRRAY